MLQKGNQAFTIPNPGTGVIVLNQKLDYEYLKQKNTETLTMVIKVRVSKTFMKQPFK